MSEPAEIGAGDLEELERFLSSFPGLSGIADFWESRFNLWWRDNPAFAPGVPRGWLIRDKKTIVGCLVNSPSFLQISGKPLTAQSTGTWMVLPEHRGRSLELLFRQIDAAKGSVVVDGTPTPEVSAVLESLGFQPLPWGANKESLLMIDAAGCARALLGDAAFLAAPAGLALGLWQGFRFHPPRDTAFNVAEAGAPGPEFDELWEKTRGLYANTNVRTAAALRWHCAPDRFVEKTLLACRKGGRLVAYMIMKPRARRGLRTFDCADFWTLDPLDGSLAALVAGAGDVARARGFHLASFPHFAPAVGAALRRLGLVEMAVRRGAYLLSDAGIIAPENSYFVALQGDAGTSPS